MEKAMPTQGTKALIRSLSDANAVMLKSAKKPAQSKQTTSKKKK